MPGLGRRAKTTHRARQIDRTDLFGPEPVFGHVGEPPEHTHQAVNLNPPAGFLSHFAVQGGNGLLSPVDPAAGQLKLRHRRGLVCQQQPVTARQYRVDARSPPVVLVRPFAVAKSRDHPKRVLGWAGCSAHMGAVCQQSCAKETLMTSLDIAWDDMVLPFQLDRPDIRGRVARLDGVLDQVLRQHSYPAPIEALVAEAALLTALIGQSVKLRWKLSLQIRGNGPARLIATDYYGPETDGAAARIRAYASFDAERLDPGAEPFSQIGTGYFAVMIDQGEGMVPYQGFTPIAGASLSDCAETYFAQSEQLPTRFQLTFGQSRMPGVAAHWRAGGIMLQHMPAVVGAVAAEAGSGEGGLLTHADILSGEASENWTRANLLLDTVEEMELVGPTVSPTDLLVRLFHDETPRVFDATAVRFGCSCSADKVRQTMSIYSQKDISKMTTASGIVTADCQFCGAHYEFDPKTLGFEAKDA